MQTLLTFEQAVLLVASQQEEGERLHVSGDFIHNDSERTRDLIAKLAEEYKRLGVILRKDNSMPKTKK